MMISHLQYFLAPIVAIQWRHCLSSLSQYWIANMESAIAANERVKSGGLLVPGSMARFNKRHRRRRRKLRRQVGSVVNR